jgi:hypothetical protein
MQNMQSKHGAHTHATALTFAPQAVGPGLQNAIRRHGLSRVCSCKGLGPSAAYLQT